jgi:hypothetical protein
VARFVGDFLLFAFLSVIALFFGLALVSTVPVIVAPFLVVILLPALFIGPLAVLLLSLFKARPGRIVGALAGVPLLLVFHQVSIWHKIHEADALNQRQVLAPQQQHEILLIQDANGSEVIRPDDCKDFCLQLLVSTPYTVVFEESETKKWFAFRRSHGADCLAADVVKNYIELLSRRFVDFCAVREEVAPSPDALIIRENYGHKSELSKKLPWRSKAFELYERIENRDRLLTRWVWTAIDPSPWFGLMGVKESSSAADFSINDFYWAILGVKFEWGKPTGTAPLETVLAALEPHFRNEETLGAAIGAFSSLSNSATPEEKAALRGFIDARIAELETLPKPSRWMKAIRASRDHL